LSCIRLGRRRRYSFFLLPWLIRYNWLRQTLPTSLRWLGVSSWTWIWLWLGFRLSIWLLIDWFGFFLSLFD
jgi:hypothetical protein